MTEPTVHDHINTWHSYDLNVDAFQISLSAEGTLIVKKKSKCEKKIVAVFIA